MLLQRSIILYTLIFLFYQVFEQLQNTLPNLFLIFISISYIIIYVSLKCSFGLKSKLAASAQYQISGCVGRVFGAHITTVPAPTSGVTLYMLPQPLHAGWLLELKVYRNMQGITSLLIKCLDKAGIMHVFKIGNCLIDSVSSLPRVKNCKTL